MRIVPVATLSIGENTVSVPAFDGIYSLEPQGNQIALFTDLPRFSEPVKTRF